MPNSFLSSRAPGRSRRSFALAFTALAALGATGALTSSCVESESTFYIASPAPVKVSDMGAQCDDAADCSSISVSLAKDSTGTVIAATTNACLRVQSGLIPRARDETNHTETNDIVLNEIDVRLLDSSQSELDSFSAPTNGVVLPQSPESAKPQVIDAPIIRNEGAGKMVAGGKYVAALTLKGRTTGGIDMQTPEFFLAVDVPVQPAFCDSGASCCIAGK